MQESGIETLVWLKAISIVEEAKKYLEKEIILSKGHHVLVGAIENPYRTSTKS